ncbi:MAG: RidA family protein [Planctomycetes bacterium]|nr:RidA family protein [Planctomycetota bacterium]
MSDFAGQRGWIFGLTTLALAVLLTHTISNARSTPEESKRPIDGPQKRAEALGIKFEKLKPAYLNWCNRSGKMLYTCGFSSKTKGTLGKDLTVQQGYEAAKECAVDILRAVWDRHGTLDGLRVVKVLGCVHATPDFADHPKVINGCSDMLHEIFGKTTDGHHARSALGFSSLPFGAAVEIEAIFEIKD